MIRSTLVAATLALAGAAQAEPVHYDFQDFWGNIFAAASVPAHLQASAVSLSGAWGGICWNTDIGVTNDFACGGFGSSTLSFTVTADAGWLFDVGGFSFQGLGPIDSGPTGFAVYSSLDGFANALIGGSLAGQVANFRYDYDAGFTAANLSGPLELRIVSTGHDGLPASAWLLDNLHLDVTLRPAQAVPEPATLALAALGLLAVVGRGAGCRRIAQG